MSYQFDLPPGYPVSAHAGQAYSDYRTTPLPPEHMQQGHGQSYENYPGAYAGPEDDDYDGVDEWLDDEEFARNLQFGLIDNGLLVAMALAGISLEEYIAAKVGVPGYGVLLGATIGNALSDGVAALPQGYKAASGVTLGALIPVIPLGVAVAMKKPPTGMTKNVPLGTSAALLAFAFLSKKLKKPVGARE